MKISQKEQSDNNEKQLEVIENLKNRNSGEDRFTYKNQGLEACITNYLSFLKVLKVNQEEQAEEAKNHSKKLNKKVIENLQSAIQVRLLRLVHKKSGTLSIARYN